MLNAIRHVKSKGQGFKQTVRGSETGSGSCRMNGGDVK